MRTRRRFRRLSLAETHIRENTHISSQNLLSTRHTRTHPRTERTRLRSTRSFALFVRTRGRERERDMFACASFASHSHTHTRTQVHSRYTYTYMVSLTYKDSAELVEHPVLRGIQPLQVLLRSATHAASSSPLLLLPFPSLRKSITQSISRASRGEKV